MKLYRLIIFIAGLAVITQAAGAATVDGIAGFATQNGGTTGGAGGEVVVVNNLADFMTAVRDADPTPRTVYISASELNSGDDKGKQVKLGNNKTIIGCGNGTFMNGILLGINGKTNIIIRNLKFTMTSITNTTDPAVYDPDGDEGRPQIIVNGGDCISIQGTSSNIWIDHCEFYQVDPDIQTNQDLYDGLIDIKNGSQYITLSWNYFHDHHKCHLVGSSDTDNYDRKITFHHNFYKKIEQRTPSYRFGTGHVFNNYFLNGTSSGINSRMGACLRIERNYFEACSKPIVSESSTSVGYWDLHDSVSGADNSNIYSGCSGNQPAVSNCAFTPPYTYNAFLDPAASAKSEVMANAGVGKITVNCGGTPFPTMTRTRTATLTPVYPTFTRTLTRTNTQVYTQTPTGSPMPTFTRTLTSTFTRTVTPLPAGYNEIQLEYPCAMEGVFENSNAGFTGDGYANLDNVTGSAIIFSLTSASAQALTLTFRYANGSVNNRNMSVAVNGVVQVASLDFPTTGGWTAWTTAQAAVNLQAGYNEVTLTSLTAEGAPNLDLVSFASLTVSDGGCVPPTATRTSTAVSSPTSQVPSNTATQTRTSTATYTASRTMTATVSASPQNTFTYTRTRTATASPTAVITGTFTRTMTPVPTLTSSVQPSSTGTPGSTASATAIITFTGTPTRTNTVVYTVTATMTAQPSATDSPADTVTYTPVITATNTFINTEVHTPVNSMTGTPANTATSTPENTSTETMVNTATMTVTLTNTAVNTATGTPSATRTNTVTATITNTSTAMPSGTATVTPSLTAMPTLVPTPTITPNINGNPEIRNLVPYPNPYNPAAGGFNMQFEATAQVFDVKISVYTSAFRKVMQERMAGTYSGHSVILLQPWKLQRLSAGMYYAVIEVRSLYGERVLSKPVEMIILR